MKNVYGESQENVVLHQLFRKSEISYTFSDISKAIGPIVDLMFISQFVGAQGVTVLGYVAPLMMLFELIGTCISSGAQ